MIVICYYIDGRSIVMRVNRILALVLPVVLFAVVFILPVAATVPDIDAVEPCAHACDCGGMYTVYEYRYSKWTNDGTQECIHGGTDEDIIQRRTQYKDLVCNSGCGSVYSTTTTTQTRLVCPN